MGRSHYFSEPMPWATNFTGVPPVLGMGLLALGLGISFLPGGLCSGKIASLEGRSHEEQNALRVSQNGCFSSPPDRSRRFFSDRHVKNLVEFLEVKLTKKGPLHLSLGPLEF